MIKSNVVILLLFISCSRIYTYQKFAQKEFFAEKNHAYGNCSLYLDDSIFVYKLGKDYYSKGIWKMSKDGKYIIINSQEKWDTNSFFLSGEITRASTFRKFSDKPAKIINYKTINFNNRVFRIVKTSR